MEPSELTLSKDWIQLGAELKRASMRKSADRGRRSVAEIPPENGGARKFIQRDGFYRPEDGVAEHLALWSASPRGWVQAAAFAWNPETKGWEPTDRPGQRPT